MPWLIKAEDAQDAEGGKGRRPGGSLFILKMVLTQVPPVEHFFDSITRWFGQEGGDLDMITMTGWDRACYTITISIGLAERRLFPLNCTPKRSQSL